MGLGGVGQHAAPTEQLDTSGVQLVRFTLQVAAGASGSLKQEVRHEARIRAWRYRFYPGPAGLLHLVPAILRRREVIRLWTPAPGADDYIAGDNEDVKMDADMPVYPGQDELVVYYDATDATQAHTFVVDVPLWRVS